MHAGPKALAVLVEFSSVLRALCVIRWDQTALGARESCVHLLDSSAGEGSGPEHDREEHKSEPKRGDRCHEVLFWDQCQRLNCDSDPCCDCYWDRGSRSVPLSMPTPMPSNDEGAEGAGIGSEKGRTSVSLTSSQHEHREGQSRSCEHLDEQALCAGGAVAQNDTHEERTGGKSVDERCGYDAAYHLCDGDD